MPPKVDSYQIVWLKSAVKSLTLLPSSDQKRIIEKIELLITESRSPDIKKLKGFSNLYRLRVGNYRIIYQVDEKKGNIIVAVVAHRKEVYQRLKSIKD